MPPRAFRAGGHLDGGSSAMLDLAYVAVTIAFFAVAAAFVRGCARL